MARNIADDLSRLIPQAFAELRVDDYPDRFSDAAKASSQVVESDDEEEEVEEATGAGSAGGYSAPLFSAETNEVKKNNLFQPGTESKLEKLKEEDEILVGGLGDDMNIADIAKLHGVDIDTIIDELEMGIEVERKEHTSDIKVSLEIALDHLTEDPRYYTKLKDIEEDGVEIEANEATTTASSGQYSSPLFLAKDSKNWRGASKPLYSGGKFVEVRKGCRTFPYCNSGDINALKLFEDEQMKNAITSVSKKMRIDENVIKTIIFSEIQEMVNK